jgi:hypothetical protein
MFPFEVLPVHPPPFPLESLTGYLVRLAEANGLTTKSGLTAIAFPQLRWKMNWSDYPCPSFGKLPQVTLCSVGQLQNTTFYPLLQKFGRALSPVHCSRFLADSISPYLRYCPLCLADHGFYSLVWRFQTVMGCPEHGVRLLESCQQCGQQLPLVTTSLKVGICPACGQDMRICQAPPLTPEEYMRTRARFDDLAYLLTSQDWDESDEVRRAFGSYLLQLRLGHRWSTQDVTAQLGIGLHVLRGLEGYRKTGRGETFTHYFQYLDLLQVSFRDVFTAVQNPTARHELRLHQVVQTVQQAIAELESRQQVVTQEKICQFLDTYPHLLRQYPEVCAILDQVTVTRKNQYRRLMVTRVQAAIDQLLDTQRVPCASAVCELLGISGPTLSQYPEAYALLTPYTDPPKWERETALLPQVEQAIAELQQTGLPPFQEQVAERLGLGLYPLRRYARIRLVLDDLPTTKNGT